MAFVPYGVIPALITPFNEDGSVNLELLGKLARHMVEQGVHGLFPLGTCGEFYAVSDEDYEKALMTVRDAVADMRTGKGKKIHIIRYKPKKDSKKHIGHRQPYTKLQILSIAK